MTLNKVEIWFYPPYMRKTETLRPISPTETEASGMPSRGISNERTGQFAKRILHLPPLGDFRPTRSASRRRWRFEPKKVNLENNGNSWPASFFFEQS